MFVCWSLFMTVEGRELFERLGGLDTGAHGGILR